MPADGIRDLTRRLRVKVLHRDIGHSSSEQHIHNVVLANVSFMLRLRYETANWKIPDRAKEN